MPSTTPIADSPHKRPPEDRRRRLRLRRAVRWLLGPDSDTLKQQQLMLIVAAMLFLFVAAVFNGLFGVTPIVLVGLYLCSLPVLALLWWLGRWRDRTRQATTMLLILLALIVAPATWFYNAGSQGPTLILYLVLVSYAVGVQSNESRSRLGALALLLLSPIAWLLAELWAPQWIVPYRDAETRIFDLIFSYAAGAVLLSIVIFGHVRRFRQELFKASILSKRLTEMARKDSLTGLLNHKVIHQGVMSAMALQRPFSLIMIDLDHFKKVNDRHGHLYGDTVLVQFALVLRACSEPVKGQVGRAGGEEFLAIIPGDDRAANAFLARLRSEWDGCYLEHGAVTFSAGVVSWTPGDSLNSLIQRADDALYGAKEAGRDRWIVAGASPATGL